MKASRIRKGPHGSAQDDFTCLHFPLLLEWFATILAEISLVRLKVPWWTASFVFGVMELFKNIFFILWARWKLLTKFRQVVSEGGQVRRRRWGVFPRPATLAIHASAADYTYLTVLPVITRELRAQSRLGFTYLLRVIGAATLLAVCVVFWANHSFAPRMGGMLFGYLHFVLNLSIWILTPLIPGGLHQP